MELENWVDIKGFEGFYQVSDLGRIMSLERRVIKKPGVFRTISKKILSIHLNHNNYVVVWLQKNGNGGLHRVSRLVAIHFIPNPLNLPEVNHKFGDKEDNKAISLEWMTKSQNMKHAWDFKLNRGRAGKFKGLNYQ